MITVYQVAVEYCSSKNLPSPSKNDLQNLGNLTSGRFRRSWCKNLELSIGAPVPDAGIILAQENGREFFVMAYPDGFKPNMLDIVEIYFSEKVLREKNSTPKKSTVQADKDRKRKRFPVNPPAYKAKRS